MRPFAYASPGTLDEAIASLARDDGGSVRALAGGTDLLPLLKSDIVHTEQLINIKDVDGSADRLGAIDYDPATGLHIGGLVKLADIELSGPVRQHYPLLAEAVSLAATPQLRNMATAGGNLLQRPRCWYFRNDAFHCWLKGGTDCPMRDGENRFAAIFDESPCVAVHPSDVAPVLLALDAVVRVRGPRGERRIAVADLLQPPTDDRRRENTLGPAEIVLSVQIPPLAAGTRSVYLKAMDRKIWAFALVSVAAVLRLDGDRPAEARLVLGGVANTPRRARAAEQQLLTSHLDAVAYTSIADTALAEARPLAQNGYKVTIAKALIRQALAQLVGA